MSGDIYEATEAAQVTVDGVDMALIPGQTTVRAGHPVLAKHGEWFKLLVPSYEWPPGGEGDDDAPGSGSPRAGTRGARSR